MSKNFGFLDAWLDLSLLGETAEKNLDTDPSITAIKCRQFIEAIINYVYKYEKISETNNQLAARMALLKEKNILPLEVFYLFDEVRKKGNDAVHNFNFSRSDSQTLLYYCFQIGVWFNKRYEDSLDQNPPEFKEYSSRKLDIKDISGEMRNLAEFENVRSAGIALFRLGYLEPYKYKYGFLNPLGEVVIEPKFEDLICMTWPTNQNIFQDGLTAVKMDGKWGFINRNGEFVVDPQYKFVSDFSNEVAKVRTDDGEFFIDKEGNKIGSKFDTVTSFFRRFGSRWDKKGFWF